MQNYLLLVFNELLKVSLITISSVFHESFQDEGEYLIVSVLTETIRYSWGPYSSSCPQFSCYKSLLIANHSQRIGNGPSGPFALASGECSSQGWGKSVMSWHWDDCWSLSGVWWGCFATHGCRREISTGPTELTNGLVLFLILCCSGSSSFPRIF